MGFDIRLVEPQPATLKQLSRAHDRDYVAGVLGGYTRNGHGNTSKEVAASLPYVLGAMVGAAREALHSGVAVRRCRASIMPVTIMAAASAPSTG